MSFFSYGICKSTEIGTIIPMIFLITVLLRQFLRIRAPLKGIYKKCYVQLLFFILTLYLSNTWPCYFTHVIFLINIDIFLLTLTTANNLKISNFFELFFVISFFSLPFTTVFFWFSIAIVWILNILTNINSQGFYQVALALLQITSGIFAINAASKCILYDFYFLLAAGFILALIQIEIKSFFR